MIRSWIARAQEVRLSTWVTALFATGITLPWLVFIAITLSERAEYLARAERNLAALAAAYAEHAALLGDSPGGVAQLAAFERGLNAPDVHFALKRTSAASRAPAISESEPTGTIQAVAVRPTVSVTASMNETTALADWTHHASAETIGFIVRTLLGVAVGFFFVRQTRWRERAQIELAAARAAAEASNRAKSEFLANMSHELRTPLNAIIGFAEVIQHGMFGPLSARYRDYAGDIFASGTHLLHVINDILDLSKVEAQQLELHIEETDITALVHDSLPFVMPQAHEAQVQLSSDVPPDIGRVLSDERRLRQVLINLLSNAVKFTPEGGHVTLSVRERDSGLAIEVRDSGIGMTPAEIAKSLEPFGQVENSISRKHEGTGLGLPLAKRLVELHGGELHIASAPGAGTTVTILLPGSIPARVAGKAA